MIEIFTQPSLLLLGFFLGLLHAFDSDHLLAVSTLSQSKASTRQYAEYGGQWAIGHGGILMIIGLLSLGLGIQLPETIFVVAEKLVGIMLVSVGAWIFYLLIKSNFNPCWKSKIPSSSKSPLYVGILHGVAGSASVLALLPMIEQPNVWHALMYLVLFSMGVLISMVFFIISLKAFQAWLSGPAIQGVIHGKFGWSISIESLWVSFICSLSILLGFIWLGGH